MMLRGYLVRQIDERLQVFRVLLPTGSQVVLS
jgi:hypothetical protein